MIKIIRFFTRHILVSFLATMLTFMAIIGSAYGFSKIAEVTSVASSIPQVKTVEQLNKVEKEIEPTPTSVIGRRNSSSTLIIPTKIPTSTSVPTQGISSTSQNKSGDDTKVSVTPSFEKDDDIEDVKDEDHEEIHTEQESEDKEH